jgi:hypothetical protein
VANLVQRGGFSGLKSNESMVMWGFSSLGGDSSTVQAQLRCEELSVNELRVILSANDRSVILSVKELSVNDLRVILSVNDRSVILSYDDTGDGRRTEGVGRGGSQGIVSGSSGGVVGNGSVRVAGDDSSGGGCDGAAAQVPFSLRRRRDDVKIRVCVFEDFGKTTEASVMSNNSITDQRKTTRWVSGHKLSLLRVSCFENLISFNLLVAQRRTTRWASARSSCMSP